MAAMAKDEVPSQGRLSNPRASLWALGVIMYPLGPSVCWSRGQHR